MKYVLKKVYPDGTMMWVVISPGFEDHADSGAARSPDPDRANATPFTHEQAIQWRAVLGSGSNNIEIEPL
jgi:hypothetical protein